MDFENYRNLGCLGIAFLHGREEIASVTKRLSARGSYTTPSGRSFLCTLISQGELTDVIVSFPTAKEIGWKY